MLQNPRRERALQAALAMLLLFVSARIASAGRRDSAAAPQVILRVYDYARVPAPSLARAEHHATEILGDAGVHAVWSASCPIAAGGALATASRCDRAFAPSEIVLNILPSEMTARLGQRQEVMGFTLDAGHFESGAEIYANWGKIEELAQVTDVNTTSVLGEVIAHELGHLLLGPGHSRTGIMRGQWHEGDLRWGAQNTALFTRDQARTLRAQLSRSAAELTSVATASTVKPAPSPSGSVAGD